MPIDLIVGLGLAKNALDIVKAVREALKQKKLTDEEMRDYLEILQDKLIDVKTALADADDERRELKQQLEEATRKADFGSEFRFEYGVYWRDYHPYCPVCWDLKRDPVRLSGPVWREGINVASGKALYSCPIDKSDFALPRNLPERVPQL